MIYKGRKVSLRTLSRLYDKAITPQEENRILNAIRVQKMLLAKRRCEAETDLDRKEMMQDLIALEQYDEFDTVFGTDPIYNEDYIG